MANIALIGFNSIEYVEKLIDIWNNGNCAILIDCNTPYESLVELMKIANTETCYIDNAILNDTFRLNDKKINFIVYQSTYKKFSYLPKFIRNKYVYNDSNTPAIIIFSSGTTGKAKGVILTHFAISKNSDMIYQSMEINEKDAMYVVKKFSHSSVLIGELLVALKYNIKVLIGPIVVPTRLLLSNISKYKITVVCINPTIVRLISKELDKEEYNLSNFKKIFISGDKLYFKDILDIRKKLNKVEVYNMYGLSEAGPRVTMQNKKNCFQNSVGVPINCVEVKVINEYHKNCKTNEYGIIFVKTPSKYSGYINNCIKFNDPKDEWINTGDIGYFDKNGELFIIGRIDDVIIIDSHKIYPSDIENKIIKTFGFIECVILKSSNSKTAISNLICLYVGEEQKEITIKRELGKYLLDYEIPRKFIKIDEVPKNRNGKRDIIKIKELYKEIIDEEF